MSKRQESLAVSLEREHESDNANGFDVTPEQERALLASIAEAERGEVIPFADVLATLSTT